MTTILLICGYLVVAWYIVRLRDRCAELRRAYEESLCWSDEYQRRAELAQAELSQMRQEYAKILWLHDGTVIPMLQMSWHRGIRRKG